jgi:hypothetical protein
MLVEDGRTGFVHEVPGPFPWTPWQRLQALQRMRPPGYPPPTPAGWVRPALPFTGRQPRRMYLRCSVWPAPPGLVPQFATQPPVPGMPGAPGVPGLPPGVPPGAGFRRRGFRRRRR